MLQFVKSQPNNTCEMRRVCDKAKQQSKKYIEILWVQKRMVVYYICKPISRHCIAAPHIEQSTRDKHRVLYRYHWFVMHLVNTEHSLLLQFQLLLSIERSISVLGGGLSVFVFAIRLFFSPLMPVLFALKLNFDSMQYMLRSSSMLKMSHRIIFCL